MSPRRAVAGEVPMLPPVATAMLESVYQHRLLSTTQLHALHLDGHTIRWTQLLLARLRTAGLLDASRVPGGLRLWFVTEHGAETVETVATRTETRRKLLSAAQAAAQLRHHTLGVNDIGLAFLTAARNRPGDECGPLSWRHEIAHPLGPPPGRRGSEQLIADALLSYQLDDDGQPSFHYRLIEFDRATMPADALADKLARYATLYRHTDPAAPEVPLWSHRYAVFPGVLLVLAGRPAAQLHRRRQTVLGLCRADPALERTPEVRITACLLSELTASGPFAEIFLTPAGRDRPTDWLAA